MFRVTKAEDQFFEVTNCDLKERSRRATLSSYVFTDKVVAMLSSVLNSERAVRSIIEIMRAFVRLRSLLSPMRN